MDGQEEAGGNNIVICDPRPVCLQLTPCYFTGGIVQWNQINVAAKINQSIKKFINHF